MGSFGGGGTSLSAHFLYGVTLVRPLLGAHAHIRRIQVKLERKPRDCKPKRDGVSKTFDWLHLSVQNVEIHEGSGISCRFLAVTTHHLT